MVEKMKKKKKKEGGGKGAQTKIVGVSKGDLFLEDFSNLFRVHTKQVPREIFK